MNAKELLSLMEQGAKLTSGYKSRRAWQKAKYLFSLELPSGESIHVQRSNVDALIKAGKIHTRFGFGQNRMYILGKEPILEHLKDGLKAFI